MPEEEEDNLRRRLRSQRDDEEHDTMMKTNFFCLCHRTEPNESQSYYWLFKLDWIVGFVC